MRFLLSIAVFFIMGVGYAQENDSLFTEKVYEFPDVEAEFPGSYSALSQFILGRINFDTLLVNTEEIDTRIHIEFIVASNGTPHSFKVENKMLTEEGKEALILQLQQMPNWKPAMIEEKPVSSKVMLPILIHLN